eukprot:6489589-Prorocentrum_lima.AAC.1
MVAISSSSCWGPAAPNLWGVLGWPIAATKAGAGVMAASGAAVGLWLSSLASIWTSSRPCGGR